MRIRSCVAIATVALLTMTGCATNSSTGATTTKGGTIVWGKPIDVQSLDPQTSTDTVSWEIFDLVYQTLVYVDAKQKIQPMLAQSWTQPTSTTYMLHLRSGVKFSNGRALSSADVVGTFKRLLDPKTASYWAGQLGPVSAISAPDDSTVEVDLKTAYTPFLASLAHISAAILPMTELGNGTFAPTKTMLGTGPWMVSDHQANQSWAFSRNPYYWKSDRPVADKLTIRVIPDDNARLAALKQGTIDVALFNNPDSPQLLKGLSNVRVVAQKTTDFYSIDVNARNPYQAALRNAMVRQAISYAINRSQISQLALGGLGQPSTVTPPFFSESCDISQTSSGGVNLSKAKQLLQAAGYSNGFSLHLIASPVFPIFPPIAEVIKQNLAQINVNVNIEQQDTGAWVKNVFVNNPATFDMALDFLAGYADPAMVSAFWNPSIAVFNVPYMNSDDTLNGYITQVQTLPVGPDRKAAFNQLCQRADQESNMIPLDTLSIIMAYRSDRVDSPIDSIDYYDDPMLHSEDFALLKH